MNENKILYSFNYEGEEESIKAVATFLNIPIEKIDPTFGVILIDPEEKRYCILVEATSVGMDNPNVFSNPKIEGFGYEEE